MASASEYCIESIYPVASSFRENPKNAKVKPTSTERSSLGDGSKNKSFSELIYVEESQPFNSTQALQVKLDLGPKQKTKSLKAAKAGDKDADAFKDVEFSEQELLQMEQQAKRATKSKTLEDVLSASAPTVAALDADNDNQSFDFSEIDFGENAKTSPKLGEKLTKIDHESKGAIHIDEADHEHVNKTPTMFKKKKKIKLSKFKKGDLVNLVQDRVVGISLKSSPDIQLSNPLLLLRISADQAAAQLGIKHLKDVSPDVLQQAVLQWRLSNGDASEIRSNSLQSNTEDLSARDILVNNQYWRYKLQQ
jgi:Cu/Ag efflux protein CusF